MSDQPKPTGEWTVEQRITDYLASGGLFNPELADHDAVSRLLFDCRAALAAERERADKAVVRAELAQIALTAELDNSEAWRLTAKGKEGAYANMEAELAAEREKVQTLVDALTRLTKSVDALEGQEIEYSLGVQLAKDCMSAKDALAKVKP